MEESGCVVAAVSEDSGDSPIVPVGVLAVVCSSLVSVWFVIYSMTHAYSGALLVAWMFLMPIMTRNRD